MPRKTKQQKLDEELASLPDRWERLAKEHFKSYKQVRQLSDLMVKQALDQARVAAEERKRLVETVGRDDYEAAVETAPMFPKPKDVKPWVECLFVAIRGEREAETMEYRDSNRAIQRVQQLGFLVTREDGVIDVSAEYLEDDQLEFPGDD